MITNSGPETIEGDGGNTTVGYHSSEQWQILETRNGSNQATRQWAWGFRYVYEPIFMDVNRASTWQKVERCRDIQQTQCGQAPPAWPGECLSR